MNSLITKRIVGLAIAGSILCAVTLVGASETTGTLSTGLNAQVGNGFEGTVVSPPVASPATGSYTSTQNVTLTTAGATSIRYTTDGSLPSCSAGLVYSSPISVSSSLVIQALSCYPGGVSSTVASYGYVITAPAAATFSAGPAGSGGGSSSSSSNATDTFPKADINKSGQVNILDFVLLMANWNSTAPGNVADINGDNKVNILDFVLLMANWTK